MFVFVHKQFEFTHLIAIDEKWGSIHKITSLLEGELGFQGVSVLSPLSLRILSSFIYELSQVDSENDYIIAINHLHTWANLFDYRHQFVKHKFETEPDFFLFTEYDDKFEYPAK